MKRIIQITVDGHGQLYALTEDGRVYEWAAHDPNMIGGEGHWVLLKNNTQ